MNICPVCSSINQQIYVVTYSSVNRWSFRPNRRTYLFPYRQPNSLPARPLLEHFESHPTFKCRHRQTPPGPRLLPPAPETPLPATGHLPQAVRRRRFFLVYFEFNLNVTITQKTRLESVIKEISVATDCLKWGHWSDQEEAVDESALHVTTTQTNIWSNPNHGMKMTHYEYYP
jgi:hypothetical protein